MRKHLISLRR